ncbi:hypothetical protein O181_079566 [Austropuccinia psidii MF-1]|uniref:Uncharacterized protein n=1 Tax=Austropuccinia psidii MF-1 TaxID=1389203 RepID=A0A9Q3FGH8_9BASI|nr:hypothetical protein [Austropuccinia psidii MF-1]
MNNCNRYKSHSEGSDRHINKPVKEVLHGVQGQGLGNVATNPPRSDELLAHPEKAPKRGYYDKKREESKEAASVASTSKPQVNKPSQEGKKKKKNNWRKPYSPCYRIANI